MDSYSEALASLLEPSVQQASDSLWVYHNLVGMVARKLGGEIGRAERAYERSLELDPNRADTLYNFANLLKDDDPDRAVTLYRRSLELSNLLLHLLGITTVLLSTAFTSIQTRLLL